MRPGVQEPKKEGPSTPATSCLSADPAAAAVGLSALSPCRLPAWGVSCSLRLGGGVSVLVGEFAQISAFVGNFCDPVPTSWRIRRLPSVPHLPRSRWGPGSGRRVVAAGRAPPGVHSRGHVLSPLPPLEVPGAPCDLSDPGVCAQAPPSHRAGHLVVLGVVCVAVSRHCRSWGASPGWSLLPCVLTALTLEPGWLVGAQDGHPRAVPRREQPHAW